MTTFLYLFNRFFYRIAVFFRHWYLDSFKIYSHLVVSFLEKLDRGLALKITLTHLFQPLYQDRSIIGYILGFIFRSIRLIMGGIIYVILLIIAIAIYFVWLLIPIYIIYRILHPIYD